MYWYMDMGFESKEKCPDFGSIEMMTTEFSGSCKREYVLKSEDVDKLSLITNAKSGSCALCVDTSDVYVLLGSDWYKQ